MGTDDPPLIAAPESELRTGPASGSLLLQLRSDRRLGHEWDDWDGRDLPNGGVFQERETLFFQLALGSVLGCASGGALVLWLIAPRLAALWMPLPIISGSLLLGAALLAVGWIGAIARIVRTGRNPLPERLAERGVLPWLMPKLEWVGVRLGLSRDRVGNAAVRVFNRVAIARASPGFSPDDLLILLPRCLAKDAMQNAMDIASRYGVPLFVAARGRYARQMIALRRPKGIVALACERDLVSGMHDVAKHLPVLGTTLRLGEGPCKNTDFSGEALESQVRRMLGLQS